MTNYNRSRFGNFGAPRMGAMTSEFPAFIRLPKPPEKCTISGLCRSTLVKLISGPNPLVNSKVLKQPGSKRGIRLIEVSSLLAYLNGLPDAAGEFNREGFNHV